MYRNIAYKGNIPILSVLVIYKHPLDYPDKFVARWQRCWSDGYIEAQKDLFVIGDTLDEVRAKVPDGLVCLQRHPKDVLSIVEMWI